MRNLGLKLVALVLACTVWFIVSAPRRGRIRERTVTAPLSLVAIPSDLVITTEIPASVEVRVRGRSPELRTLSSQSVEVAVDLKEIRTAGEIEMLLRAQSVTVPPDIDVVSVDPGRIRFRLERLRRRTVPIRPFLAGDPPAGYVIGEVTTNPAIALVSGPESQILQLSEVATERIIMTGRTATFMQNVPVVSESPLVRVISPLVTQITVPVLAEVGPAPPPEAEESPEVERRAPSPAETDQ